MRVRMLLAAGLVPALLSAQVPRWTHFYDGPAGLWDQAWQVRCGPDSGVYVCGDGQANAIPLTFEMTALGLTNSGSRRWACRFTGPGSRLGQAYALAVTDDRDLVVGGTTFDIVTANDFTLLGISDSGSLRWQYRLADSGVGICRAVACDRQGNAYAAGTTRDYQRLTVAALDPAGNERWLWREAGADSGEALAVAAGDSGQLFVAGWAVPGSTTAQNFCVARVDTNGASVWFEAFGTEFNDTAVAVAFGADRMVYAAGHIGDPNTGPDIYVAGMSPVTGNPIWDYQFDYGGRMDQARALLCAADSSIYVAGFGTLAGGVGTAFLVLSFTRQGQLRWVYADTGARATALNIAGGLAEDAQGNIYACGILAGTETTRMDAAVVSLISAGELRWRHLYAGPDSGMDYLGAIICGPDNNLYACGMVGEPPNSDWLVLSFTPSGAVRELAGLGPDARFRVAPVFRDRIRLACSRASAAPLGLALFDPAGRVVLRERRARTPASAEVFVPERLSAGVYLLEVRSGADQGRFKMVKPE